MLATMPLMKRGIGTCVHCREGPLLVRTSLNTNRGRRNGHRRSSHATKVVRMLAIMCLGGSAIAFNEGLAPAQGTPSDRDRCDQQQQIAVIERIARDAVKQYHLKSIIVQVRCDGGTSSLARVASP